MGKGIDYGMGQTNIDKETGIRYGVIHWNLLNEWIHESLEADYGDPHCPNCGNEASEATDDAADDRDLEPYRSCSVADYGCTDCGIFFDGEDAYGDEPQSFTLTDEAYTATAGTDGDIFILKSPYYTKAEFCSPCAPGACYLASPDSDGDKAYCFGPDYFDDDRPCPYHVYRVDTDELVYTPAAAAAAAE